MPRYLFNFCELCGVLGQGTPENPGGDFDMYCWIDAPSRNAALDWGYVILGDYFRHRYASTSDSSIYEGSPDSRGDIVADEEWIAKIANEYEIPECEIDAIPEWNAPWRISNLDRKDVH